MQLFDQTAYQISKLVTENFSTSFSNATSLLDKNHRDAIYAIYGFVRFADEIVDTFHDRNKAFLLDRFEQDLNLAMELGISLNPVLHSFQMAVKNYKIPDEYISAFLTSMKSDLNKKQYKTKKEVNNYIYGSADVVGLMCLCVFCDGNHEKIEILKIPAMKLGSAFQKVNFLRDIRNDLNILGRTYFPQMVEKKFDKTTKEQIIEEIKADFREAYKGIKLLPSDSKRAVYLAYVYYSRLLKKLENTSPDKILTSRIRISDFRKLLILIRAKIVYKLNLI